MARKEKKYHFIYKTTNLKNGKFYVGMHSTNDLNDGYLGSGDRLRRSIRRNGKDNFKLEILEFLPDRTSLSLREKELINEDLLKDPMCMNLKLGGFGGFVNDVHRDRFIEASKKNLIKGPNKIKQLRLDSEWVKKFSIQVKLGLQKSNFNPATFKGKLHSVETKQKISEAKKGKGIGNVNSQFGTMWITNSTENKKIKKEEIIPIGWKPGRVT
jgi:group I intron endonuclease